MTGMRMISCIRFAMQLLIGESVYVFGWRAQRKHPAWPLLAIPGYFLACALAFQGFSRVPGNSPVVYILYYASLFAISLLAMKLSFRVKWPEVLFAGVCGYATQHIAFAAITVINQLTGLSLPPVADFFLVRLLPYVLISAGVWVFIIRRNEGKGTVQDRDMRMVLLALAVLFTVIFISVLVDDRELRGNSALLQNVFCKMYAIVCCLLAIFVAYFMSRQNQILKENEIMEGMLRQAGENQKLSQETINIINIKCHDLKYRLSHLPSADSGQKEYIDSVSDALTIYDNTFQTGSEVLDLVLTEKSLLCSQYHVKFSCMADGGAISLLSSPDLYALFGNLMDNAIESVLKEPDEDKRIVSLTISRRGRGSHVHIENYCGEAVEFADGLPLTTKEDKANHGFGVRSIRYIVEKYEGDLLMRADGSRFLVDILFFSVPG